jgi:hypothetical protein
MLKHVGKSMRHLGGSSDSNSGKENSEDGNVAPRVLSTDSQSPVGLEDPNRRDEDRNSNDPILPGTSNRQVDSDDDEEASAYESATGTGKCAEAIVVF